MHMHFLPVINEQNSHKQLHTESYGHMGLQSLFIPHSFYFSLNLSLSLPARCEAAIFIIRNIICINHKDKWLVWLSECLI